jgi:hypothetical protein
MIIHVQDEILAHDSQPNESNVGSGMVRYSSERLQQWHQKYIK